LPLARQSYCTVNGYDADVLPLSLLLPKNVEVNVWSPSAVNVRMHLPCAELRTRFSNRNPANRTQPGAAETGARRGGRAPHAGRNSADSPVRVVCATCANRRASLRLLLLVHQRQRHLRASGIRAFGFGSHGLAVFRDYRASAGAILSVGLFGFVGQRIRIYLFD
jgi:hypothetical protein